MAFTEKNNALYAEDVALSDIAKEFGTPTYVYSAAHIRGQFNALKTAMEKALPADKQPLLCRSHQGLCHFIASSGDA